MLSVTVRDMDMIFSDFGLGRRCAGFAELQRYDYEDDPTGKSVRLIVKAKADDGAGFVVRFKSEKDVTLEIVEAQSAFAAALRAHGVDTPQVYASGGRYARAYELSGYDVIVTVEEFTEGELHLVDAAVAEKTGRLLARMHNISEYADLHVDNEVLFDPLAEYGNDLFDFEAVSRHGDLLRSVDGELYDAVEADYRSLVQKLRGFENEPRFAVQGDISDCNLYMTPNGGMGVFDFNRSGDNVLYFDAVMQAIFEARLMDYPDELAQDPEPVILPAFLRGYNSVRPFTPAQRSAFPCFYALVSAFWLGSLSWGDKSLAKAVKENDLEAVHNCMKSILKRARERRPMPI